MVCTISFTASTRKRPASASKVCSSGRQPEAANVDRYALSRAPGAMLYLAGSIGALMLGFDGTIPPRLRNVVGMDFRGHVAEIFLIR